MTYIENLHLSFVFSKALVSNFDPVNGILHIVHAGMRNYSLEAFSHSPQDFSSCLCHHYEVDVWVFLVRLNDRNVGL
jgi:hypothetical protein